jgi:signal transduction histidine kinase
MGCQDTPQSHPNLVWDESLGVNAPDFWVVALAHEIRNPLSSVALAVDLLSEAVEGKPKARAVHDVLRDAVRHMSETIDDILDLCRSCRGKLMIARERVELSHVVSHAVKAARPLLTTKCHSLLIHLPPPTIFLDVQASRLQQIISNLLTNAAKYTDPGGHISLLAEVNGETLAITVCDDGGGIDPQLLPYVFDPFWQGTPGSCRRDGIGLGLAIVKCLVQLHGGTVTAHSYGLGHGSSFVVALPVATHEEHQSERSADTSC